MKFFQSVVDMKWNTYNYTKTIKKDDGNEEESDESEDSDDDKKKKDINQPTLIRSQNSKLCTIEDFRGYE